MHEELNLLEVPQPGNVLVASDESVGQLDEALDLPRVLNFQLPAGGSEERLVSEVSLGEIDFDEVLLHAGYADFQHQLG